MSKLTVKFKNGTYKLGKYQALLQEAINKTLGLTLKESYKLDKRYALMYYTKTGYSPEAVREIMSYYIHTVVWAKEHTQEEYAKLGRTVMAFTINIEQTAKNFPIYGGLKEQDKLDITYMDEVIKSRNKIRRLAKKAIPNSKAIEVEIARIEKYVTDWLADRPEHPISVAISSGIYNKLQIINSFVVIGKQSHENSILPYPVAGSYYSGMELPVEFTNESYAAATANKYSTVFVPKTEIFAKEAQFNARNLVFRVDDCGTTIGFVSDVNKNVYGMYAKLRGEWVVITKYNYRAFGPKAEFRVPFHCLELANGNICKKCVGMYQRQLPPSINIIYVLLAMFNEKKSQKFLSTKHFIASAITHLVSAMLLPDIMSVTNNVIKIDKDVTLTFSVNDVTYVGSDKVSFKHQLDETLSVFEYSHIRDITIVDDKKIYDIDMKRIGKCSFTKEFLIELRKNFKDIKHYPVGSIKRHINKRFSRSETIKVKAGTEFIVVASESFDIKAVTQILLGLFSMDKFKLEEYNLLQYTDKIERKLYFREEHIDEYVREVIKLFTTIGDVPLASLSMFITMLSVDRDNPANGMLGKGYFRSFSEALTQNISRGLGKSTRYNVFSPDAFVTDDKSYDPMDVRMMGFKDNP